MEGKATRKAVAAVDRPAPVKAAHRDADGCFNGRPEPILYRKSAAVIDTSERDSKTRYRQQRIKNRNGWLLATGKTPIGLGNCGFARYRVNGRRSSGHLASGADELAYFGARFAKMRCNVRRCMLRRRAVSETFRLQSS